MKKIIAGFLTIAILFPCFISSAVAAVAPGAVIEGLGLVVDFGSFLLDGYGLWQEANPDAPVSEFDGFGSRGEGFNTYWHSDSATCPSSPDGYHYIDPESPGTGGGINAEGESLFSPRCLYCHELFSMSGDSLSDAYKNYLGELPATGIDSTNALIIHLMPSCLRVSPSKNYDDPTKYISFGNDPEPGLMTLAQISDYYDCYVSLSGSVTSFRCSFSSTDNKTIYGRFYYFDCIAPITGFYTGIDAYYDSAIYAADGELSTFSYNTKTSASSSYHVESAFLSNGGFSGFEFTAVSISIPNYCGRYYSVVPDNLSSFDGSSYTINSRPTSISGDYGIIGDNGQITKVDTTTIVNETNNTFTNPSTGTTSTISDWTYDYSDRSYDLTLDTGETVTVTYGDENVTIQEGDTVYNVYYIVDGTGQGTDPDACQHEYTSTIDREATCTVPGQTTYTCSLCGHTYTEAIPAKGHTWTVSQTVTTEYDQEGNLLQQGYTIYQCSVCGEQYKDETGTGPPDSGGGAGTDGESIWDKLGNFLGTVFGGIIGLIEAILGPILEALTSLAAMIGEKLAAVVNLVVGMFTEIPLLFTGFLGFLSAVFPFFPEDIMTLLTFGIAVVVFIGIIKALRR